MDLDVFVPGARLAEGPARSSAIVPRREPRASVPQNPAEVLALLMDFSGSVALAKLLHAPAPVGSAHPDAGQLAGQLQERVRTRLDALLPLALRPLANRRAAHSAKPEAPRRAMLPKASELLEAIELAAGAPGCAPEGQAGLRLARDLGAPLRSAFSAGLRQLQAHFASLRAEIAGELRALGPRADRLERIDAALQRSIQRKQIELFERLQLAAELSFERACLDACAELPAGFGASELEAWAADGGWMARERTRCERVIRRFFRHLGRNLEVLLLAAIQAEVI